MSVEDGASLEENGARPQGPGGGSGTSKHRGTGELQQRDVADVRGSLRGDGEAYRRLVERHQQRVSAIMWRFARDAETHEDLVQDVFVEAYQSLSTYRARAPFSHWLARIATRVGYRHWKRERREGAIETVSLGSWHAAVEPGPPDMEPAAAAELLHRLLALLPPRDRLVLTLRYLEEHSLEETAALTGWSKTMVKVQAWRARKKLRSLLQKASQEVAQ